jgi:hypothetical protein
VAGPDRLQRRRLAQHRLDLLLVVGGLHDIGGDYQQAVVRHRGLCVVALLEAAAGRRHDPRFLVGQVDLVARPGTRDRRCRRLAAGLLAACLGLGLARRHLGFIFGLLAGQALAGARLDLAARLGQLLQSFLAPLQLLRD